VADLNKLRFTSAAALVCIAYTTCLIVANFLSADKYSDTVKTFHLEQGVFASLPIANVAFTLHYNAPRYYQELKNRSIPQLRKATLTAFSLCICVYVVRVTVAVRRVCVPLAHPYVSSTTHHNRRYCFSAIGGYMVFGERTEGNILNNYADDDIGADIARVALTFVIVFTYPLAFHSLRSSVLVFAPAWLRNSQRTRHHVAITVAILSFTTLMGILLPQVQVVLGFNGAIFGSCMVYIFPALMYASLRQQHKRRRAGYGKKMGGTLACLFPCSHIDVSCLCVFVCVHVRLCCVVRLLLCLPLPCCPCRSLLMPSVGGVQLVSLAATPHLVAGGTGAAEVDENSLATPVFNPTANDSDFAGSGTATGSSRPPWHFAVDFMKTREGIPYAVLVGFGLVVAFLGLLVTVGVL